MFKYFNIDYIFNKMKFMKRKLKERKIDTVYSIATELCKLNSPDYYHLRRGLGISSINSIPSKMFNYIIDFKIDDIDIEYCYQIRGSLITINKNKKLLKFVDQTTQYNGILFLPHDIHIDCSKRHLNTY